MSRTLLLFLASLALLTPGCLDDGAPTPAPTAAEDEPSAPAEAPPRLWVNGVACSHDPVERVLFERSVPKAASTDDDAAFVVPPHTVRLLAVLVHDGHAAGTFDLRIEGPAEAVITTQQTGSWGPGLSTTFGATSPNTLSAPPADVYRYDWTADGVFTDTTVLVMGHVCG